jgi:hypothetical protein
MDKIARIKRIVESSLDTSFGGEISIVDLVVLPTQTFNEETKKWIPDSHTIFLSVQKKNPPPKKEFFHYESDGNMLDARKITILLEGLLGFEVCVDIR